MSLIARETTSVSVAPIPEGAYVATCYAIIDTGLQYSETYKNSSRKVFISWELADEFIEIDGEQKPRYISQTYTLSLAEKSNLRHDLVAWRGKEFTAQELKGFELKNVLGKSCMLGIVHSENNGKIYANISSIMNLPKGTPAPKLMSDLIYFDLEESPLEMIESFPEFLQTRIKGSITYEERINPTTVPDASDPLEDFAESITDDELPF